MPRASSIVRGRRRSSPQVTCRRSRERFRNEGRKRPPGSFERPLKMAWLNPDQGQRRAQSQQPRSFRASGQSQMCFEKASELLLFGFREFVCLNKFKIKDVVRFATHEISEATSHTGAKVEANGAKNSRDAAGHVFATMLANTFNNGGGAVENRVPYEDIAAFGSVGACADDDCAAGEALADVVVRFAEQFQREAGGEERAEALTCGATEFA